MAASICPNCSAPLNPNGSLFGPGKPGLQCTACETSFAPGDVTRYLFELAGIPLSDLSSAVERGQTNGASPRTCPVCEKPLARFTLKGIELELCSECGTTVFDPGELYRLTSGKLGKAPPAPKQGVFEMLWDCEHCDTRSLLGKTNRFCPVCGAPQDPKRRRFPEPGQEVAANTEYDGADASCPACSTANGAKAKHCRHCGSPMDGSKQVARVADQLDGQSLKPVVETPAPVKKKRWPFVLGGLVTLFCGFCGVATLWTKPSKATVSSHTWERAIDIEQFTAVNDDAWCDSMPSGAYSVSRSKKQRSTNKVADGQTCSTRNVDRGDGTFERKQECQTKYREEPVYDDHCSFRINRWEKHHTLTAKGSLRESPAWPAVSGLNAGSALGSEREGPRHETYTLGLSGPAKESWSCELPQARWQGFAEGSSLDVKVRVMTGGIDCSSLP